MTQEEKQLLLKDLYGRLPYGVIIECGTDYDFQHDITDTCELLSVNIDNELCKIQTLDKNRYVFNEQLDTIKPYLRPMSSMTDDERIEYRQKQTNYEFGYFDTYVSIDWLNKKMFDYRHLIPMGLALPATEDMYK